MEKREKKKIWNGVKEVLLVVIKLPYFFVMGIVYLIKSIILIFSFLNKKSQESFTEIKVKNKREKMNFKFEDFKVIKIIDGKYEDWKKDIFNSKNHVGIILGARGSGKTAIGVKILENIYANKKVKCFALGFKKEDMPSWIEVIEEISEIKNDSWVLIDEGGIFFSSRKSMTTPNKLLSDLILISRHKNLNILFISQNSSNLDVNIIRQADFLILKPSSLLQKDFERKKIKEIYEEVQKDFQNYKNDKTIAYIYSDAFRGFVKNPLPSFWSTHLSKSFEGKE